MPDIGATVLSFVVLGLGYSIFLIIFVGLALIPRSKYLMITLIGFFLLAIFFPLISYINPDISWVAYLSPLKYFDAVGLLIQDVNLVTVVIPEIIVFGIISIVIYVFSIKWWSPRRDIA